MQLSKENNAINKYQNRVLGFTLILLIPFSIIFGLINHEHNMEGWWYSVSRTYYATDGIIMMSMLAVTLVMFISYRCRFKIERFCTIMSAIATFGVLAFPHGLPEYELAGIFLTPYHIGGKFHIFFASMLFVSYGIFSVLALRKEDSDFVPTKKSSLRSRIYLLNGILIFVSSACLGLRILLDLPEFLVIFFEALIFVPFGINLLIKAGFFKSLRD